MIGDFAEKKSVGKNNINGGDVQEVSRMEQFLWEVSLNCIYNLILPRT